MSDTVIGMIGIIALFGFLMMRMPVAISMITVGFVGIGVLNSWNAAFGTLVGETFVMSSFVELSVIPLFVLMGNVASVSGMSKDLYNAAYAWVGAARGGLASATIVGCAGFAALSGSSVASALTMGRAALPEMKRFKYDSSLATGSVAAGGTLGILIPPSTGFVIYAILTEESIGRLFMAGVLPGLLLTGLFVCTIILITTLKPSMGPTKPKEYLVEPYRADWRIKAFAIEGGVGAAVIILTLMFTPHLWYLPVGVTALFLATLAVSDHERFFALLRAFPIVGIILSTLGGIYFGWFTPVEAAGVGAFLAIIVGFWRKSLTRTSIPNVLRMTVRTSALSFLILIGAHVFSPFLALSQIPQLLSDILLGLDIGRYGVLAIILLSYIIMGTFLEGFAMLVLTLPIIFPLIVEMGFDPIWFGVVVVITLEMGLISPPVGVNVFVVKSIAEDVPMSKIFWGILPFWFAMLLCVIILVAFPQIATFLPNTMFN
jgi:TRAP-type C4-dicarboxylate transport system permease large subunit